MAWEHAARAVTFFTAENLRVFPNPVTSTRVLTFHRAFYFPVIAVRLSSYVKRHGCYPYRYVSSARQSTRAHVKITRIYQSYFQSVKNIIHIIIEFTALHRMGGA